MRVVLSTLNARFSHSSLALRYLRSLLRVNHQRDASNDLQIVLAEYSINEQIDYILGEIYRLRPDLIGFSVYIWNLEQTLALCSKLKLVLPDAVIVLGGPEVSFHSEEILKSHPGLDVIVIGEGEETFSELVQTMQQCNDLSMLKMVGGLAFRNDDGVLMTTSRRLIDDLDQVVSPYQGVGVRTDDWNELENRTVYLEGSRGCPNRCQYCLSSVQPGVRFFSWPRVKADLEALVDAGVKQVKFVDRTFNCDTERAHMIWEFIIEQYQKQAVWQGVKFHFEISADRLTQKNLELLQQVPEGNFDFEIGVQSTHPDTQKAIMRRMDWERLKQNVNILRKWGNIHLHLDLIAGLPFESYQTFRTSFKDVYNLRPHRLQLGFLKLLKGSGLRESASQYGYRFSEQPPYEILGGNELEFCDILRLRLIEDLVEKYYNTGRFVFSLGLLELFTDDAMSLYEAMADFWEKEGHYKTNHSNSSMYQLLMSFAEQWLPEPADDSVRRVFEQLLKMDYLRQPGMQGMPQWMLRKTIDQQKKRLHRLLHDEDIRNRFFPEYEGLSVREINTRIQVEVFDFNLKGLCSSIINGTASIQEVQELRHESAVLVFKPGQPYNKYLKIHLPE